MERQSVLKVTSVESPGAALMLTLKWPRVPLAITPFVVGIGRGVATIVAYTSRSLGEVASSS